MMAKCRLLGLLVLVLGSVSSRGAEQRENNFDEPAAKEKPKVKVEILAEGDDGFAETGATPAYKAAYKKALDEANVALKEGTARLFSFGFLGMSDLDPETGLAAERIAGCVITEEVLGRTEGNNDRVHAWIKEHGPTPNSLLRWKDELSDLPAFFEAKAKAGATIPLRIGGPTLKSPDGRFTIRQVSVQVIEGSPPEIWIKTSLGLEVSEQGEIRGTLKDDWGSGLTDLAWGPPGAPFVVVKSRSGDKPDYQILHLRPVDWLSGAELSWQRYVKEHPGVE